MAGNEFEAPSLCDGREEQDPFHPGEPLPDTDTHASAEWEIREFRALVWFVPTFGSKLFGLREPARVAMDHPRAQDKDRPRRHGVFADRVIGFDAPSDGPRRRIKAHGFGEYAFGVLE